MHLPKVLTMVCNTWHKNGIKHVQTKVNIFLLSCGAKINKKLPITPVYAAYMSEIRISWLEVFSYTREGGVQFKLSRQPLRKALQLKSCFLQFSGSSCLP